MKLDTVGIVGTIIVIMVMCKAMELEAEDPEVNMTATELITSKGFPAENYYVTTADGYILNILRIPHGRNNTSTTGPRPVVVLQHGLLGSCTNFLTNLVNESLAFILADAGADVWMGNSRGNLYSANHTKLHPKQKEFWQFSWDQMAEYDLPAMINFILETTRVDKLYYVGHSQGTTIAFAGFSNDPALASHIEHYFAMAPVAEVWHMKSPIKDLSPLANNIAAFFERFGNGEFELSSAETRAVQAELCQRWGAVICANYLFVGCGFDYKSFNLTRMPVYMGHNPAGTSVTNILHWAQGVNSKKFQAFNYSTPAENIAHYGQPTPPVYDPSKVKIPVSVYHGGQDWLADEADVGWLLPQLNVTHEINIPHYAHLDFIWAFDAPTIIYRHITDVIFS